MWSCASVIGQLHRGAVEEREPGARAPRLRLVRHGVAVRGVVVDAEQRASGPSVDASQAREIRPLPIARRSPAFRKPALEVLLRQNVAAIVAKAVDPYLEAAVGSLRRGRRRRGSPFPERDSTTSGIREPPRLRRHGRLAHSRPRFRRRGSRRAPTSTSPARSPRTAQVRPRSGERDGRARRRGRAAQVPTGQRGNGVALNSAVALVETAAGAELGRTGRAIVRTPRGSGAARESAATRRGVPLAPVRLDRRAWIEREEDASVPSRHSGPTDSRRCHEGLGGAPPLPVEPRSSLAWWSGSARTNSVIP